MEVAGVSEQRHFVLVHGSCHGAWCWYKLPPLLESAGHRVTALDLGASGVNPKLLHEVKSFWDYVEPLMEFMASLPEDERVVFVGHSYDGLPVSLAMERFPEKILVAVFLTAYMPDYNSSPGFLVQEVRKHFVLVHGSCHGAWCWYKLAALLKAAGHHVTAVDLGGCGVNPKNLHEIASFSDYVQPLMEFMASLPREAKVILVGHSYGGFAISLAMESFPNNVAVAVYVTAFMPSFKFPPAHLVQEFFKRTPIDSIMDFQLSSGNNQPTSALISPKCMTTMLYQQCPTEDVELAKMLLRPSGLFLEDLANLSMLTEEKFGSVDRVFVICEEDKLFDQDFQNWFIEKSPANDVKSISGADHMIMLSKPKELCLCLQDIAENYC